LEGIERGGKSPIIGGGVQQLNPSSSVGLRGRKGVGREGFLSKRRSSLTRGGRFLHKVEGKVLLFSSCLVA